jgi:hypothetical protein
MTHDHDTLTARIRALEDWQGVLDTLHRYVQTIDLGPPDAWADCFTADGVYEASFPGGLTSRIAGTSELHAFADKHPRPPAAHHAHIVVAPIVEIDGDSARASSVVGRMSGAADGPQIDVYGRCDDELVRCSDGRWRFERRVCRIDAAASSFRSAAEATSE